MRFLIFTIKHFTRLHSKQNVQKQTDIFLLRTVFLNNPRIRGINQRLALSLVYLLAMSTFS